MNKLFNTKTRFFGIWKSMHGRIGRGYYKNIKIDPKWKDFENFYSDMYKSYCMHLNKFGEKNTSIERVNNNGNYCKENCIWATQKIQANNRRTNSFITHNGKTLSKSQWSRAIGISRQLLNKRLNSGWSIERALKINISSKIILENIIKDVMKCKFGTKNRSQLILQLNSLKKFLY